jgi:ketosteroid isomerase-like protein
MSDPEHDVTGRLRRAYDAFSRGNFDRAMEIAHPDIEFVPPGGQAPLRGAEGFRAWMEPDALEENRIEAREMRINGDKVLVRQHAWARGAGSGIELEVDAWAVWTVNEDGLVTRVEGSSTTKRARPSRPPGCRSRRCRRKT